MKSGGRRRGREQTGGTFLKLWLLLGERWQPHGYFKLRDNMVELIGNGGPAMRRGCRGEGSGREGREELPATAPGGTAAG